MFPTLLAAAGCSPAPPSSLLSSGATFIAVPREGGVIGNPGAGAARGPGLGASDLPLLDGGGDAFYLAIARDSLVEKWFLSAYLKQLFPGAVNSGAARSLGTRVVRFALQNGKLFVFDADDSHHQSDVFDPTLIVDAYPVVDYPPFAQLAGADRYLLVDPASGLNRFGVLADSFAKDRSPPTHLTVALTWLQRFRAISDGATWEQVLTGYTDYGDYSANQNGEPNPFRVSGTLGVALRRYSEGSGFTAPPSPNREFFFRKAPAFVQNTGTQIAAPIKWNIHPGMTPIQWKISSHLADFGKDPKYKNYDLVGAARAGIEGWNQVFGFPALAATVASPDDSFADDDVNYLIFDPDPSLGYAFANWRINPNTGEVRGASVYFGAGWITYADSNFKDDGSNAGRAPAPALLARPKSPRLQWDALPEQNLCDLWAPPWADPAADTSPEANGHGGADPTSDGGAQLTKSQKLQLYVTHVIAHEIGHTLGLRHNFKGSLVPPTSSVMDYLNDADRIAASAPQTYDAGAIRYLYGLAMGAPPEPFCTDEDTGYDPDCVRFDRTVDPLDGYFAPRYAGILTDFLEGRSATAPNNSLNGVLRYLRAYSSTSATRVDAWILATDGLRVPVSAQKLADFPGYADSADQAARNVLSRLYLDAQYYRGDFYNDPPVDALWAPMLNAELRGNLLNLDGIRSFPTRRVSVDVLKKLQTEEAYELLLEARSALGAQRAGLSGTPAAQTDDLLARIDAAIHPYFAN